MSPYVDGDPTCQPRRLLLDATTHLERWQSSFPLPVVSLSLSLAFFLGELRCGLATSPELSSPPSAKPARQKLLQSLLYLDVTSSGKAALPGSGQLLSQRSSAMLTGDVARPPCSTISSHSCSYSFPLTH